MDDALEVNLLGGDQRKTLREIKTGLGAEHRKRPGAGAVLLWMAFFENKPQKLVVLAHEKGESGRPANRRAEGSNRLDSGDAAYATVVIFDTRGNWMSCPCGRGDLELSMTLLGEDRSKIGRGKEPCLHFFAALTRTNTEHNGSRVMHSGSRRLEVEGEFLHAVLPIRKPDRGQSARRAVPRAQRGIAPASSVARAFLF